MGIPRLRGRHLTLRREKAGESHLFDRGRKKTKTDCNEKGGGGWIYITTPKGTNGHTSPGEGEVVRGIPLKKKRKIAKKKGGDVYQKESVSTVFERGTKPSSKKERVW